MMFMLSDVSGKIISANYTYKSVLITHVLVLSHSVAHAMLLISHLQQFAVYYALRSGYDIVYCETPFIGQ